MPRVLVVDDDPALLRAYRRLLRAAGIRVEVVQQAREALERLGAEAFDVVVSDIHMPSMNGIGLLEAIRKEHGELPVILVTGCPGVDTAVQALEGGALHYLYKPVEPAQLTRLVSEAAAGSPIAAVERARRALEARFARALDRLWIAYQPIVSLKSRRVIAFEALCRSEEEGLENPGALLQAAEDLNRVHALGRVIRERAVAGLEQMPADVRLFINLHPQDLLDDELLDPASPAGRAADRVILEVTERRALSGIDDLPGRIVALKKAGYGLAVDDLGAGYASLSSFAALDAEVVKIDMSLVRDVDRHPKKLRLIETLVALGHRMGADVVVEGVETEGERDVLTSIGCDWMQGFLFARPGPRPFCPPL